MVANCVNATSVFVCCVDVSRVQGNSTVLYTFEAQRSAKYLLKGRLDSLDVFLGMLNVRGYRALGLRV